ncbi:DMT family transporter [Rhodobacter sp. NSM]|uniref:DMT family transporter n=1 Tax=Rhodobacter sp. NSM TaxID=3457501 RepID=UPI003FD2051F
MQLSDNLRGALVMTVAMAAFTVNDALMKAVTQTLPLFEAIALRGLATLPLLLLYGWTTNGLCFRIPPRDRKLMSIRAGADVLATIFYLSALMFLPLANLVAILQSLPLAVTLVAALFLGEPLGWRRLTAILVGFGGVLLIVKPGAEGFTLWSLAGLASVGCVVARDLVTRQIGPAIPSATVAIWNSVAVTAMGLAVCLVTGMRAPTPAEAGLIAAAAGALIVGYLFIVAAMRVGDIGTVSPFRYTALIWAIGLGWLIFGNLPSTSTLVGSVIVAATGIFTLWREARLARGRKEAAVDIPRDSPYTPPT